MGAKMKRTDDFLSRIESLKIQVSDISGIELSHWLESLTLEEKYALSCELTRLGRLIRLTPEEMRTDWTPEVKDIFRACTVAIMKMAKAGLPLHYPILAQDFYQPLREFADEVLHLLDESNHGSQEEESSQAGA